MGNYSTVKFGDTAFGREVNRPSRRIAEKSLAEIFSAEYCLRNRKKSHGAMSGEYGGWGIVTVLFLAKNSRTSNEM